MPLFFFNVANGVRESDTKGVMLADLSAARVSAIRFAGDIMSHEPDILTPGHEFRVEVTDGIGRVFFAIVTSFSDR